MRTTMIKNTTFATIPFESKKLELVVCTSAGLENESIVSETEAVALDKASPAVAPFIEGSGDESVILNIYTWIYILIKSYTLRIQEVYKHSCLVLIEYPNYRKVQTYFLVAHSPSCIHYKYHQRIEAYSIESIGTT